MNSEDIIYVCLLLFSISFAYFHRGIGDKNLKKNVATAVGLLITLIVSRAHICHSFVTFSVNAIIILNVDKTRCHLASFAFSFLYLLFFRTSGYFGFATPSPHANLAQMMLTLKLVGLAFEVNSTYQAQRKREQSQEEKDRDEINSVEPNCLDIFHYAFNYVGVLTGPYYKYRTFVDYYNYPFADYSNWRQTALDKLKWVPLYGVLFLWGSLYWPASYVSTDEFHESSFWYRYVYIFPNFLRLRMRLFFGLVLSDVACIVAGLGAYPVFTNPKLGQGPSKEFSQMKTLVSNEDKMSLVDYNYEVVHNMNVYKAEFCITYREALKHWNGCVQYWLAVNVYQRFPSKRFRAPVTMFVSAFWHGLHSGYYICIGTLPLVFFLDDVYYKLCLKDRKGNFPRIYQWVHWFVKLTLYSYQMMAFNLLEFHLIWGYYNSVYHANVILGGILYLIGSQLLKAKRRKEMAHEGNHKGKNKGKVQ